MQKWNMIIDVAECTNCNLCTLAVMDEYVGNEWPGYTAPMPKQTAQEKIAEREAQRRDAMKLQQERKEEFARRCGKSVQSAAEQEFCRAAYRKL